MSNPGKKGSAPLQMPTSRKSRDVLIAFLVVLLSACPEKQASAPEVPVPKKAEGAPAAPPKSADAAPPASAPTPMIIGRISYFTSDEAHCRWVVVALPSGDRTEVAQFGESCHSGDVMISPDHSQALITLDTERLYLVKLATRSVAPLTAPKPGTLGGAGFTSDGTLAALTLQSSDRGKSVTYEGKTYRGKVTEGIFALAHSFTFADGKWSHQEVKPTTTGWDYAEGVGGLKLASVAGDLSPSAGVPQGGEVDAKVLEKLNALKKPDDDSTWVAMTTEPPSYYVQSSAEFAIATPTVAFTHGGQFVLGEDSPKTDQAWIEIAAPYVMLAKAGDRGSPRIYAIQGGALLFKDDRAVGARFVTAPVP